MADLLHKELSYQIQGVAFEVRNNYGLGHKEKLYQTAFAEELTLRNIIFEKEKHIAIYSPKTSKKVGTYQPDFIIDGKIIDGKIIVELKAVYPYPAKFIDQLYSYLRNSVYELGYFINFSSPELYIKRIIYTNDRKVNIVSVD